MWLRVLWVGASTSSSILLLWFASRGERLSGTWRAAVGVVTTLVGGATVGAPTLGGGTIDEVNGVASDVGVGTTRNGM